MGIRRSDPEEVRKLALMRMAAAKRNRYSLSGKIKEGGHAPKPVTLPAIPWKDSDAPADTDDDKR